MSDHFLDTSALVKHYHAEIGTPKVELLWNNPGARLFVSRLGIVETVSTLAKKVRTGLISVGDFHLLRRRFFADLRKRRPMVVRFLVCHHQEADRLLQQHGLVYGLHTLDAIQLAVALDLANKGVKAELVTADHILLAVAPLEGLAVNNPEVP
jgi:uncharacterized protein